MSQLFDINEYLQQNAVNNIAQTDTKHEETSVLTFHGLVEKISNDLKSIYDDKNLSDDEMVNRQHLEHNAVLGLSNAENMLISEIEKMLREQNLLGVDYPAYFDSLAHAVFHEIYRFGSFYKWESYPNSPSAMIVGKEIWFKINGKFVKQEEEMRSDEHIQEIFRLLQIGNSSFKVNEANPQDEVILKDGVRIKAMIPPLSSEPTLIFRRFIVDNFSFQKQASYNTIPYEDIPFYEALSNLYLNTNIAGQVESGKSTFLKTIYGARDQDKVAVLIESSPESFLKRDFPNRLVHELYTDDGGNTHQIMRDVLRIDHDYVIVQEVRGVEAEGAISATERGTRGTLMTYHITDPRKTAEQLSQHITDEFPNRKIVNEVRRISQQLDLGITMETIANNTKKVTSVYELCYDHETDRAWINYLVHYNKKTDEWEYNGELSDNLKERLYDYNSDLASEFINHLEKQSQKRSISINTKQPIHFKE